MRITLEQTGPSIEAVIDRQVKAMTQGAKLAGRAVAKAGAAAVRKASPKSFAGYPLKVKTRVKGSATRAEVEIYGTPAGFWAILDGGASAHQIRPRRGRAVSWGQGHTYAHVNHPGTGGRHVWANARGPLVAAVDDVVEDAFGGGRLMADKRIEYEVTVDSGDGVRGLQKFSQAAKKSGRDVENAFDDTGSAADKAAAAIVQMGQKVDAELRETAQSADALAQALGPELAAKVDTTRLVADFQKMGLTLEDIKGEADTLATALKQVDDIKLQGLKDGLDYSDQSMQRLRGSSDQSRSVLANLAGNAAQDLGQLGGVVGSLGVGIGQMAEYAVDGNIAMSNLAKVAGPMAGLSAALLLVQHVMGGIAKQKAFETEQVDAYAEAIDEVGVGVGAVQSHLEDIGKIQFAADSGILGFGTAISDITDELDNAGISVGEFSTVVAGSDADLVAWGDALMASHGDLGEATQILNAAKQAHDNYNNAIERGEAAAAVFASTQEEINDALYNQEIAGLEAESMWRRITKDMIENGEVTGLNVLTYNKLQTSLGLNNAEMAELTNQKVAEKLEEDAAAADAAAAELAQLSAALIGVNQELNSAESRAAGFAAALARIDPTSEITQAQETQQAVTGLEDLTDAYSAWADAVGETDFADVDVVPDSWDEIAGLPDDLPPVLDALAGFRETVQSEMAQAFEREGPQGLRDWAASMEAGVREALAGVEGITEDQVNQILASLGLLPDQVDTLITLSIDQQKIAVIDDIVSGLGEIPPVTSAAISMALNNQDPELALSILNAYLTSIGEKPVTIAVNAETGEFQIQMEGVTGPRTAPVTPEVTNADPAQQLLDQVADPRTAYVAVDDEGTVDEFAGNADEATEDRTTHVIVPKSPTLGQMQTLIDHVARARTVNFNAKADNAGQIAGLLDSVARARRAVIIAEALTASAEHELNTTARTRHSTIVQHSVTTGGGGGGGGPSQQSAPASTAMATTVAAPAAQSGTAVVPYTVPFTAPTPAPQPINVTVNAAVIGSRFEVQRAVAQAMRSAARLGAKR